MRGKISNLMTLQEMVLAHDKSHCSSEVESMVLYIHTGVCIRS